MLQESFMFDNHDTGASVEVIGYFHDEYLRAREVSCQLDLGF